MNLEKYAMLPDIEARKRRLKRLESMMVKSGEPPGHHRSRM